VIHRWARPFVDDAHVRAVAGEFGCGDQADGSGADDDVG